MQGFQWTDPFLATVFFRCHGVPSKIHGLVIRVAHDHLVFQTFSPISEQTEVISVAWGDSSYGEVPVLGWAVHAVSPHGAMCYRLDIEPVTFERRYSARKNEQLALGLLRDGEDRLTEDLEVVRLPYPSIFEVPKDVAEWDVRTTFLGKSIAFPVYIAGMTGGSLETDRINRCLADAAAEVGIPMAVGSQRAALERGAQDLRTQLMFPDHLPLIGNIGVSQVASEGVSVLRYLHDMTGVDAISVHLNMLQELVQWDGDRVFAKVWDRLRQAISDSPVPIILKETGCGFAHDVVQELQSWPLYAIEFTSQAGTNWVQLEGYRANNRYSQWLAEDFSGVGHSAKSQLDLIRQFQTDNKKITKIASGGISRGIHVLKWLYAGADMCTVGRGALRVWHQDGGKQESLVAYLQYLQKALQVGLALTRKRTITELVGAWSP